MDNIRERENKKLNNLLNELKSYIIQYDFLPVLAKAFINDNFIFTKSNGIKNDDYLLAGYIADLYYSFQKEKKLEVPDENTINLIFDYCMNIYKSCFFLEMTGNEIDESIKSEVLMLKYTERSFYIPVFMNIFTNIIDEKYLLYFYEKTGFRLQDIFVFRATITLLIQDRYENKEKLDGNFLAFSEEEILNYINTFFPNFKLIDIKQINNFIDFFRIVSPANTDYLPRITSLKDTEKVFSYGNKYICSEPLALIKRIFPILEKTFDDDPKLKEEYYTSKADNLEKFTKKILEHLFPEADIYQGLEYFASDKKWHETDVIVNLGNYLIIIEAKAKKFRPQARQGNSKIYNSSINNIITEAHEQCKTTYEYIKENETCSFSKKKGREPIVDFRKDDFIDTFLFTVELEDLESITSDIYKTLPIYNENPILTFSIYDLFIIADVLKSGALFLIYLQQRRQAVKDKQIHASNELDYLSLFLDRDLKFNEKDEAGNPIQNIFINEYSDDLDKYYIDGKKIKSYPLAVGANILFQQLRNYNERFGFVIEKEFRSANIKMQKDILKKIELIKKKACSDEKGHDCSFLLEEGKVGISFFAYKKQSDFTDETFIRNYAEIKITQTGVKFWFYVVFTIKPNKVQLIDYVEKHNY